MLINKLPPPTRSENPLAERSILQRGAALAKPLAIALLLTPAPAAFAQHEHTLPLVLSTNSTQPGFVRIINRSDRAGTVTIHAIDDSGQRFGPVTLSLEAMATRHFNSRDLERGNPSMGLSGGVGVGDGNWRLVLDTELDIEPLAYIRTSDGFVASVHDVAQGASMRWHVPFFNPGSNTRQRSRLRLVNTAGIDTEVVIDGLDDRGAPPPEGEVRFTLPADAARTISAQELEAGADGFSGRFGDGAGKWQLFVSAGRPIQAMSLLATPTGHLSNLSTVTGEHIIRGSAGGDELWGGNGDDIISPGDNAKPIGDDRGFDTVHGSSGDDRIIYTDSGASTYQQIRYSDPDAGDFLSTGITATIDGTTNRATVDKGAAGTDTIVNVGNPLNAAGFELLGTNFNDVFRLTLDEGQWMQVGGGAGNDTFNVRLIGGWVRINYHHAPDGVNVDLRAGRARNDGFGDVDTFTGDIPKGVAGSEFSDVLRGSDRDEWFFGRRGNDNIDGGGGSDMLQFGYSSRFSSYVDVRDLDVDLEAGTATGTWNGNAFSYTISNIEQVWGGVGNDTLRGAIEEVRASTGNDTITYTDGSVYGEIDYYNLGLTSGGIRVTLDGGANRATVDKGAAGVDTIVDIADLMSWDGGGFGIYGTNSNDIFNLTIGDEQWMQVGGGAGDDTFNVQADLQSGRLVRIDYKNAQNGVDVDLRAGRAHDDGFGDVDTIHGDVSQIRGSDFADVIRGSDNDEHFIGRQGDDIIDGRGGHDVLRFDRSCCATIRNLDVSLKAGTATGTWNGSTFSYTISSIEEVRGGDSDDNLIGSPGGDRLRGGEGSDFLDGGSGNDELDGGDGEDIFLFEHGHGEDYISDFTDGEDIIILSGFGVSKSEVLSNAGPWSEGVGVWIDLSGYGGGRIDLGSFDFNNLDESDFLL